MTKKDEPKLQAKEVLLEVANVMTEKPVTLDIDVKPKNKFHGWLIRRKIKPSKRHFEIKPQRVANVIRIAGRAVSLDLKGINPDPNDKKTMAYGIHIVMDLMNRHGEDIIYIVACAVQNDHREPTEGMLHIVRNEFEMIDLFTVLSIAVSNYNINSFLNSIALIVGVNILNVNEKASPNGNGG